MRTWMFAFLVAAPLAACGWPATRMVPAADYTANARPTISAAPAYTAGTNYVLTTSPHGYACDLAPPTTEVASGTRPAC